MARIEGVELPARKRVEYGLTYLRGIGLKTSRDVLKKLGISFDKRIKDLSDSEVVAIQKEVTTNYVIEADLLKEVKNNIRRLQEISSYRGVRHKRGLPVHGQRTKTNARTRKGPRKQAVPGKKKAAK